MSRIKATAKEVKKESLNTTIPSDVINPFKTKCRELSLPMNYILTLCMQAFVEERIVLVVGKNNKLDVDIEE